MAERAAAKSSQFVVCDECIVERVLSGRQAGRVFQLARSTVFSFNCVALFLSGARRTKAALKRAETPLPPFDELVHNQVAILPGS